MRANRVPIARVAKLSHRRRSFASCSAAFAACLLASSQARAQFSPTQEFQTGFSLLRFEPAKAGDRFFGVPDASVPGNTSSRVRALVLANYATAPLLSRTNAKGQTVNVISKQFSTSVELAYLPIDSLLVSAGVPIVWTQSGDSPTTPSGVAAGDTRVGVRYALLGGENAAFSLAPAIDVWLPTGSQDKLTGDGKLRAEPALGIGGRSGAFVWAAKAGYQFRRHLDDGAAEIGNSFTFGAAAGLLILDDALQLGPEVYGTTLTSPSPSARATAAEALFGIKVHAGNFVFGIAGGPGLSSAPGTAPRALLSAAFAPRAPYAHSATTATAPTTTPSDEAPARVAEPQPLSPPPAPEPEATAPAPKPAEPATAEPPPDDTDGDGIPDSEDACKRVPGVASETPKWNGCPVPPDTDGDGVVDPDDACPKQKGDPSKDPKLNGCPAIVKAQWAAIGVNVQLRAIDAGVFFSSDVGNPDTAAKLYADVEMYTTGNDFPDPTNYLAGFTCAEIAQKSNNWKLSNVDRYCNKDYDALFAQLTKETDEAKRKDLIVKLNDIIVNDVVIIPLVARSTPSAMITGLKGPTGNQWDTELWNIAEWSK